MEYSKVVFDLIVEHGFNIKGPKCWFAQQSVELLGHIIDGRGFQVDSQKLKAAKVSPRLLNTTKLRSLLGLALNYHQFIQGFATISATLHASTSIKAKCFNWTYEMEEASQTLKDRLNTPPVLAYPRFQAPFVVETDANTNAIGFLLAKKQYNGKIHPNHFPCSTMTVAERKHLECKREALAIIFALKKFRLYLLSTQPFKLITDHQALKDASNEKHMH